MANRAFSFRIYPNREQEALLAKTFGCCRFVWNRMLTDKKIWRLIARETIQTTPAQYKRHWPWLAEVDGMALCNVQLDLEKAFRVFFRNPGHFGFPRYKSRRRDSYTTNLIGKNIRLQEDGRLRLPKLGPVKIVRRREIPEGCRLKSVTVSRNAAGQYRAALLCEFDAPAPAPIDPEKVIGLDFSMPDLYVDSDGGRPGKPGRFRAAERRLARERRRLHRCRKGSRNRQRKGKGWRDAT